MYVVSGDREDIGGGDSCSFGLLMTGTGGSAAGLGMALVAMHRAETGDGEFCSFGLLMSGIRGSAAGLGMASVAMHSKGSFGTGQFSEGKMDLGEADDLTEDDSCASLLSLLDWFETPT